MPKISKTEQEWREELSPDQFEVLRHAATERPFTGALLHNKADGTYRCAACGTEQLTSEAEGERDGGHAEQRRGESQPQHVVAPEQREVHEHVMERRPVAHVDGDVDDRAERRVRGH